MIEVFGTGDIFGEIGVIDGSTRSAHAVAEGRVRLLRISGRVFMDALNSHPVMGADLCRMFAGRLRRTSILFRDATFESLDARLARQLLYLGRREGRRTEQGLQLAGRFRQGDLADLLGATTRSIITILNSWRADGLVDLRRRKGANHAMPRRGPAAADWFRRGLTSPSRHHHCEFHPGRRPSRPWMKPAITSWPGLSRPSVEALCRY